MTDGSPGIGDESARTPHRVVVLCGGVGGARMLDGFAAALPEERLCAIVNTGDDFEHWGLRICPDLDTVMYTLSGLGHEKRGWGLKEESFSALAMVEGYGGEAWFQLGDRDLGTHLVRSEALRAGESLSSVTARLFEALGVRSRVLPMCDAPRPTFIETVHEGTLPFQQWLVRRRGQPRVKRVELRGQDATPAPGVLGAISEADLVVIAPSNPYVSIDPIVALTGMREALAARPVVAVSPIVGGRAVKGPLAEMIRDLAGRQPSPAAIAAHYEGLVDALVVQRGDEGGLDLPVLATETVMGGRDDRARLAREVLAFAAEVLA